MPRRTWWQRVAALWRGTDPQSHHNAHATGAAQAQTNIAPTWLLDAPFLRLSDQDQLTTRDLFEGVLALGNPGSGKTSTTGTMMLSAALQGGWGVAAFCTKPDDRQFVERLAAQARRTAQVIVVSPTSRTTFNLMRYEMGRPGAGAVGGRTLRLAMALMEAAGEGKPVSYATDSSEFFRESGTILLTHVIDALRLAQEELSLRAIERFLGSAPKHLDELEDVRWKDGYCFDVLRKADAFSTSHEDRDLCERCTRYWLETYVHQNERTRGDITATIDAALFQLGRAPIRDLLDAEAGCSFVPEVLEQGAILIVDCPPSVWGPAGKMVTIVLKRLIKDMIRRRVVAGNTTRPIMLYLDECQTFVTRDDAEFQQICRSNRAATVMMTQSVDNLEAALGNDAHTNSLANALTTHVYHATSGATAEWIERRIATAWRDTHSFSFSGRRDNQEQHGPGMSVSEGLHPQVLASELTRLRTGGPLNHRLVQAIVFKPGRRFAGSDQPYLRVQFQQG